jgi:hypothetical protein
MSANQATHRLCIVSRSRATLPAIALQFGTKPRCGQLGLSDIEEDAPVSFMQTLTEASCLRPAYNVSY